MPFGGLIDLLVLYPDTVFFVAFAAVFTAISVAINHVHGTPASTSRPKPLVVLDLNNVLVFRTFQPKLEQDHPELIPYVDQATLLYKSYTWERPHSREFLCFLLDNYRVAVWSSAWQRGVDAIVAHMFGERRGELLFEWSQEHCDAVDPHPNPDNKTGRPLHLKRLSRIVHEFPQYDQDGILMVDDSAWKMMENPSSSVFIVEPWFPHKGDGMANNDLGPHGRTMLALEYRLRDRK